MGGTREKRLSREERRARLLDAAVRAIRANGTGVSMEQLATAGGVTKPILYRHFGDRDGLIIAIGDQFAQRLLGVIIERLEGSEDPEERIRVTVDAYLQFIEEDPNLYGFLLSNPHQTTDLNERVGGLVDSIGRQVAMVLGDGLRQVGMDAGAAEPWAFGIVGMVHQAGDWWLRTGTMRREAVTGYLTSLLWHGMANQQPSGGADEAAAT